MMMLSDSRLFPDVSHPVLIAVKLLIQKSAGLVLSELSIVENSAYFLQYRELFYRIKAGYLHKSIMDFACLVNCVEPAEMS